METLTGGRTRAAPFVNTCVTVPPAGRLPPPLHLMATNIHGRFLLLFLAALPTSRDTPSPIDPETIQVPVTYDPDPADLALSSVPGQEMFDPRKRKFSAEELKPQPMIKKARKVFIPEDLKVPVGWGGGVGGRQQTKNNKEKIKNNRAIKQNRSNKSNK